MTSFQPNDSYNGARIVSDSLKKLRKKIINQIVTAKYNSNSVVTTL